MRIRRAALLATAVFLLAACTRAAGEAPGDTAVRAVDEPLPTLSGQSLTGQPVSSKDFLGKVLVVNAWASWCTPCELELPQLAHVSKEYRDQGVRFLGIDHMDQEAAAKVWVDNYGVPYPSISDPDGTFAASLDYIGLPDTYVVDPTGTIRYVIAGATNATQLSGLLDQLLASQGSGGQMSASSATATNSPAR